MDEDILAVSGGMTAGSRIAGYLLEEQIGQGGMAVVFRALDLRLKRQVALKILAPVLAADGAFRQRFIRESQLAAAVDDPHIIPVFEAGEASGVLFIAMRLVRGGDVGTLVRRGGPLLPSRAAAIIAPVAAALDAAHEAGLVHRDVKPANMLLDTRSGRPEHVYLSDFGLSKAELAGSTLTGTGQFLGTLDYSAPEQIEGRPVDGRADQYALASAAFELLTGSPPFQRDDAMAIMHAHISQPPPGLTSRRPDFPRAADAVVARALAKVPADRYGSCREFSEALRTAFGIGRYDPDPGVIPGAGWSATDVAAPPPATDMASAGQAHDHSGPGPVAAAAGHPRSPATEAISPGRSTRPQLSGHGPTRHPRRHSFTWAAVVLAVLALAGTATAIIMGRSPTGTSASGCRTRPSPRPASWSAGQSDRPLLELGTGRGKVVEGMAFSPDGETLAIGTFGGTTYLVNAAAGGITRKLRNPRSRGVLAVAISCNGQLLAAADRDGSTYLWDLTPGARATPVATLTDPASKGIQAVAFSPDGKTLAAGDAAGSTYLWHVSSGTKTALAATFAEPAATSIQAVAFSPDGKTLATGDAAGSTYLWHVTSDTRARLVTTLTDPASKGIEAVAFNPAGTLLGAGDATGSTHLWNLSPGTGYAHRTLADPGASGAYGTVALAFSPDGTTLAAGGYTGQTYLWRTATRTLIASLLDPGSGVGSGNIQAVAFSPDGSVLATGDTQGSTYLWTAK